MNKFADKFVVRYFHRSVSINERIKILNEAIQMAGIDATYNQFIKDGESKGHLRVDTDKEFERAEKFIADINACYPKGQFEWESNAVEDVIERYKNEK